VSAAPRPADAQGAGPTDPRSATRDARFAGFWTLLYKELLRFWKVSFQTVAAPILTAVLYLLIFGHVLEGEVRVYGQLSYTAFLVPGLVMMSMLQNAFANSSSSLIQSKVTGNIVFVLLPPLSYLEFFAAYTLAAMVRGLVVGLGVVAVTVPFAHLSLSHPAWTVLFALVGTAALGAMGVIAGIWAEKFDQLAGFQNFVIMPLTFLAGVFYSIHSLPAFWQRVSHLNPFFYMIDGFRYGFHGVSDVDPLVSLGVSALFLALLSAATLALLRSGYKLRH
jgi:ABC-2 type transport system permease protein